MSWDRDAPGVLELPSGRLVRGRGLRNPFPPGPPPEFSCYLLGKLEFTVDWDSAWIRWPDFRLPRDRALFDRVLREALERSGTERVEFACGGGKGRTGTALACLAVLDGIAPESAVDYVRGHYASGAVETPWQRRFVARFRR